MLIIHEIAIEFYDSYEEGGTEEQTGVKDSKLLLSALREMEQTFDGQELYPDIFSKTACLVRGLIQNHSFHNANKRTGILAMIVFLGINDYEITAGQHQLIHFARRIAIVKPSIPSIALQIKKWSVRKSVRDKRTLPPSKRRYLRDFMGFITEKMQKLKSFD